MNTGANFKFTPKPIEAVGLRSTDGTKVQIAAGVIQRIAALRAYENYSAAKDWMGKLSAAYVVAIATRSADELLMNLIKHHLEASITTNCRGCKVASIGVGVIRQRLFPRLKELREKANDIVHHLDEPVTDGVSDLNIEAVFDYCHCLFQENAEVLFGTIPNPSGRFPQVLCRKCRSAMS